MKKSKLLKRQTRHKRIRRVVMGTKDCPRLAVFRSHSHIYAQIIDDLKKETFDRGGFLYHGRIAQVAKGAREGGLQF